MGGKIGIICVSLGMARHLGFSDYSDKEPLITQDMNITCF